MGVDYLRLQCVRGTLLAVCRTVESLVATNGWRRLSAGRKRSAANFYKELCIREESAWVVIDAGEGHSEPWAARIASSLGTTGIKLTSYSDEDAIELDRYDAGRCTKHLSHRFDATLSVDRFVCRSGSYRISSPRRAAALGASPRCARATTRVGLDCPRDRPTRPLAKAARRPRVA